MSIYPVSRRVFIKNTGGASLALWLGLSAKGNTDKVLDIADARNFTPYILVKSNGDITIFNIKPEMGQGTFQSVPALIAEEFEVAPDQFTVKLTNGETEFGNQQSAGGSSSIRSNYATFRKIGASAKAVFVQAAATKWNVNVNDCYAERAAVYHRPTKKSLNYSELVAEASAIELPKEPKLKDEKDFKLIGRSMHRSDVLLKTNGSAVFGIDMKVPGMLYASIERCAVIGGTLKSFDATDAMKVSGVVKVVEVERIMGIYKSVGVAVIADSYWNALQGRKRLKIEWNMNEYEQFNTEDYERHLRALAKEEGIIDKNIGSVDSLNISADNTVEAFYETPMVAHHTLEPMNCIAQVKNEAVEIWTSTQVPSRLTGSDPNNLHDYIGFAPEKITLHTSFIGGGFGRRLYFDYIIEAINIAKRIDQPVKLIWSREDTTEQGPFRPMTFSQLKAGFSGDGNLISFQHKVISPSLGESTKRPNFDKTKVDGSMVEGIGEQAYEISNLKTSYVRADFHVPVVAWRSVTSSTLAFAHECFIDELAYKAKKDPMEFRLSLLNKDSDLKRVLLKLKEVSNWDQPMPKGKGRGVGQWEFFAGLCGQVVEVTYKDHAIKVDKVYAVIDLGKVVNPDTVKGQVEGGIIMGLVAATKPCITLENGKVAQHNFYDNPLIRINEVPEIEVHILTGGEKIKGVGEPGLPPLAPALANAVFAATGKRIRKLPFDINNIS